MVIKTKALLLLAAWLATVSSRLEWGNQKRDDLPTWEDGDVESWEQPQVGEESWDLENSGEVYYESDHADWKSKGEEDCAEDKVEDADAITWDGFVNEEPQGDWPASEPWQAPEEIEWTDPEPAEWTESEESTDFSSEKDDCGENHDEKEEVYDQNLPEDVYSQAYVDALRNIGVENIAGGAKGITYSFYTSAGACKTPEDIQRDVSHIQRFEVIRIYDTDCDGLANILKSMGPHQKVFAGIHYPEQVETSVEIISQAIYNNGGGDWGKIHTVSVGNEMVNFGKATPGELAASIQKAKSLLNAKGYNGPVVTTDTLVAVLNNHELCKISDYIAVNSHPYWDGGVPAQQAGPWLASQLQMLDDVCERNGKEIVLAETGWPHTGKQFGEHGAPSKDNQMIAIKSIVDTLGPRTILFTTFNDHWKDGGSHDVEKYWGIFEQ